MSHKSGHVIIEAIERLPGVPTAHAERLSEIKGRDEYTLADRLYLGWVVTLVCREHHDEVT